MAELEARCGVIEGSKAEFVRAVTIEQDSVPLVTSVYNSLKAGMFHEEPSSDPARAYRGTAAGKSRSCGGDEDKPGWFGGWFG